MIRAVVWKELREQGLIAVMLAVLGGGLLVAAAAFADPPAQSAAATDIIASLGVGRLLALMLVVTAGMVCGGALFAAEKEAGTMAFLDALPTDRAALWRAKIAAGLVLAAVVVGALLGTTAALGLGDISFLRRLVIYAVLAFAWGTLGSTLARTTLGSVGVAIPAATLAAFLFLLPIYLFLSAPGLSGPRPLGWAIFEALMVVTPLALSARWFTASDRARAADAVNRIPVAVGSARPGAESDRPPGLGIRAVAWLTLRQLRVPGLVLSAFALAFGSALLLPNLYPLFVWPPLALAAGVFAGLTAFGDEQSHRSAGFWAEHRLPIGRAWGVKIGIHLAFLLWLLVLLALPSVVRTQWNTDTFSGFGHTRLASVFRSRLFDELGAQGWKYLFVPAVYGFVFGHVCGLLFRKLVVACGVAALLGGVAAAAWGPSLLAGGVKHWQVWGPAAAVLLTGRLLIRAWAADRLLARGPVWRLVGGAGAAMVALAGGLTYRIFEVPDDPTGRDDEALVATLKPLPEGDAGQEFRSAAERFVRLSGLGSQGTSQLDQRARQRITDRLDTVTRTGWNNNDHELAEWLEQVYTEPAPAPGSAPDPPWWRVAEIAAQRPVTVYESPTLINTAETTATALDNARKMARTILTRGLQRSAGGDPGAFLSAFRTVVALARNLRNGGGHQALSAAIEVERFALLAADHWLELAVTSTTAFHTLADVTPRAGAGAHPALSFGPEVVRFVRAGAVEGAAELARAAAVGDDPAPFDARPHLLVDRYYIRGVTQAPNRWLTLMLDTRRDPERAAAEADLVALAWAVPWERERSRRLVGLAPEVHPGPDLGPLVAGRPGGALLARARTALDAADTELQIRILRRVTILKAALVVHHGRTGRPPAVQEELVTAGVLVRLPEDPHMTGRPFGYRVSAGESLVGRGRLTAPPAAGLGQPPGPAENPFVVPVRAGQVVVWSVGPDRIDQGGKVPPGGPNAEDLVSLVPVFPAPR